MFESVKNRSILQFLLVYFSTSSKDKVLGVGIWSIYSIKSSSFGCPTPMEVLGYIVGLSRFHVLPPLLAIEVSHVLEMAEEEGTRPTAWKDALSL